MERERIRTLPRIAQFTPNGSAPTDYTNPTGLVVEYMKERTGYSSTRFSRNGRPYKSTNVEHTISRPAGMCSYGHSGGMWNADWSISANDLGVISHIGSAFNQKIRELVWEDLPTSNEFSVIQFLAEFDELPRLLGERPSYGGFTWGIAPFISDIQSLLSIAKDLQNYASSGRVSVTDNISGSYTWIIPNSGGSIMNISFNGTYRFNGQLIYPEGQQFFAALDAAGIHPDLATLWDLIPFSFLVDYFVKIGDFLEQFRSGGWTSQVVLDGWASVFGTCTCTVDFVPPVHTVPGSSTNTIDFYFRQRVDGVEASESIDINPPQLDGISFRDIFNTGYIATRARF